MPPYVLRQMLAAAQLASEARSLAILASAPQACPLLAEQDRDPVVGLEGGVQRGADDVLGVLRLPVRVSKQA